MSTNYTDQFHQLFPEHEEPKLPISIYNRLLDTMDEESAFDLFCKYERGLIDTGEVSRVLSGN